MKSKLESYNVHCLWHFTDKSNIESIKENGLLSFSALEAKGMTISAPGGNDWSHEADKLKKVDEYVHLAFCDQHPMEHVASQDGRIKDTVWLKINLDVLNISGVKFTNGVSNKNDIDLLNNEEAISIIDFDVLFTRTDWSDPKIQERLKSARKSEILIPNSIPLRMIEGL